MAADLATILETVTVTQLLTPTGKALGEKILERGKQVAGKAVAYLAAVGRQPQDVAEKLLVPMALGAGLESDPILVEKWAALLANAADPTQRVLVRPGFVETLRQLTPVDAKILALIYQEAEIDFTNLTNLQLVWTSQFREALELTHEELLISIEELVRLKLCDANFLRFTKMLDDTQQAKAINSVYHTIYGATFLAAVTPPAS